MSTIVQTEQERQGILSALADEQSRRILQATRYKAKSANDLMREEGIPKTSLYRKLDELLKAGLILPDRFEFAADGKKYELFVSKYETIDVRFGASVEIEVTFSRLFSAKTSRFFSID
mgnify:CR=1 FL=1